MLGRMRSVNWVLTSKSDSRFNKSGDYNGLVTDGMPDEAKDWIEFMELKTKTKAPEDLEYSCMKD